MHGVLGRWVEVCWKGKVWVWLSSVLTDFCSQELIIWNFECSPSPGEYIVRKEQTVLDWCTSSPQRHPHDPGMRSGGGEPLPSSPEGRTTTAMPRRCLEHSCRWPVLLDLVCLWGTTQILTSVVFPNPADWCWASGTTSHTLGWPQSISIVWLSPTELGVCPGAQHEAFLRGSSNPSLRPWYQAQCCWWEVKLRIWKRSGLKTPEKFRDFGPGWSQVWTTCIWLQNEMEGKPMKVIGALKLEPRALHGSAFWL